MTYIKADQLEGFTVDQESVEWEGEVYTRTFFQPSWGWNGAVVYDSEDSRLVVEL